VNPTDWWRTRDVMTYLGLPSERQTRLWMTRRGVRRAKADRRFTTKEWVDEAMQGKGGKPYTPSPYMPTQP
jgi:hypothetical protein